jgi:hypothetical protein
VSTIARFTKVRLQKIHLYTVKKLVQLHVLCDDECVLPGLDDADGLRARDAHVPAAGVLAQCPDPSRARDQVHREAEDPAPSRQHRIMARARYTEMEITKVFFLLWEGKKTIG